MEDKRGDDNNLVDRISVFPDEILVSIVSLLPLKEAQATSILSNRWRHVWESTTTLNFDIDEKTICRLSKLKQEEQELEIRRYVDWVNSVVEQHRCLGIERFRVCIDLDCRFSSSIDKWIQFAMRKGVRMLELDFIEYGIHPEWSEMYTFPDQLLGIKKGYALEHLCSDIPSVDPSVYIGFKSLKVLDFKFVDVDEEVLEYFLSNCPVLEQLSVCNCSTLGNLRVVGPSIALKCLVIKRCFNIKSIEICDTNLFSFTYEGEVINFILRNVPLLVEVSIGGLYMICDFFEFAFTRLSCCLSQMQILKLNRMRLDYNKNRAFPILENLKHLELNLDEYDGCNLLKYLTSFIKVSPYLHKLVVQVDSLVALDHKTHSRKRVFKKAAKCSHHYLKVVEMVGYDGHPTFEIVKYLTKTAVKLEKIVIYPDSQIEGVVNDHGLLLGETAHFVQRLVQNIGEVKREKNRQKLKEKVPSTVELIWL